MYSRLLTGSILALSVGQALAKGVAWAGLNIAGMDFGCEINGACDLSKVVVPLSEYQGQDGAGQMKHFVQNDKFNAFRLPVGWQFLVNNVVGGKLDEGNFAKYDALMKACLATGAHCIIDIHNYARWDGAIIGQGGPTNDQFADLWSQLMTHYAAEPNVVVGMVNEPHDIPDIDAWAQSCQAVVNAVRKAGAEKHMILLPGTGYTSAGTFVSSGSAQALSAVKNPDGSVDNLVFDVHKYLDADNSGTHTECVSNNIDAAFKPLASWLKENKRVALLSEIGGGSNTDSCMTHVCEAVSFLNENSDVYLGYMGWGAGSFDQSYKLTLTPKDNGGTFEDQPLLTKCFVETFGGGSGTMPNIGSESGATNSTGPIVSSSSGPGPSSTLSTSYIAAEPTTTSAAAGTSPTDAPPSPGPNPFPNTDGVGSGGQFGNKANHLDNNAQDEEDDDDECEAEL